MLKLDTREVPQFLMDESQVDLGTEPLSTERYTSAEFAALENEKMWPNVWQFAAREEDFPNPGDTIVFDNAGKSYLIVRQDDCLLYTSPSPRDATLSRMPSSA